jgi:hypothetical protein
MPAAPATDPFDDRIDDPRLQADDPQAILELAQRLESLGREHLPEADRLCAELIARFPDAPQARLAEEARTRIAQQSVRCVDHGEVRAEVVRWIADALAAFAALGPRGRERIALEIAQLGHRGLDIADPEPKYALQSLPGTYCGLHLLAILYAAFRQIDPTIDIGADFLREYELALAAARPRA